MKENSLKRRALDYLKKRRQKILNGGINTVPSPFKRFSNDFIGTEQAKYYIVTGQTKSGKSQVGTYIFIYNTLLYAYENPNIIRVKIFYYPLEETPEDIFYRFVSYYLYIKSNHKIEISPEDLKSSKENRPLSEEILNILDEEEYNKMFDFFEEHIIFSSSRNPTGIYNEVKAFMQENGTVHYKKQKIKDDFGGYKEIDAFDYYTPNDSDLYTIVFIDHISLINPERGMTLKQAIDKTSEYCVILRNRYGVTPVVVQQQSVESESTDSIKLGRIRPTIGNLSDSKYTSKDANVILGIFSPYRFELPEYNGYDVKLLKDNFRLLEVIINRGGSPGGTIGLYFNGKCNFFSELPLPNTLEIQKIYKYIQEKRKASYTFLGYTKNVKQLQDKNKYSIFATHLFNKIKELIK